MFVIHKRYLAGAAAIFLAELLIALGVHDDLIRPWGGDFLVVILLYCLVRGLLNVGGFRAALGVLLFAYTVEALQYFQIVRVLHLDSSAVARTVVGTSFSWSDMLAYTLGVAFVLIVEEVRDNFGKL